MGTILVVHHEPFVLEALHNILTDEGYSVVPADSGEKAVEMVRERNVDIVILDALMPDADWIDTLHTMQSISPDIGSIVTTSFCTYELVGKAIESGVSDLLEAPLSLEKTLVSIKNALHERGKKPFRIGPDRVVRSWLYNSICIYPETSEMRGYLENFCRGKFCRVSLATEWTDVIAIPFFIAIIDTRAVKKSEWDTLFGYLSAVPDAMERFVLSPKAFFPKMPKHLKKFFTPIEDRKELEHYILYRNKKSLKRMGRRQQAEFLIQRKEHITELVQNRNGFEREFLIKKLARYYNVSTKTIQRDAAKMLS